MITFAAVTGISLLIPTSIPGAGAITQEVATHVFDSAALANLEQDVIASRFSQLAETWMQNTRFMSTQEMITDPAYQQIIGMGRPALPLILDEMQKSPNHWFWALFAITGHDVAAESQDFTSATQAWLEWGTNQGLISPRL
jgi:hypothetical protein